MTLKLKKGQIWLANLNPTRSTEASKTRPVLLLQDQTLLDVDHPSTLIIPLTTNLIKDAYPLRIRVHAKEELEKDSDLLIDQICAIDNKRLIKGPLASLEKDQLNSVYAAMNEVIGDVEN